jgi:hypothetical protein
VTDRDSVVEIRIDPTGRIDLAITRKNGAVPVTERISAASAAELRLRNPEAYQQFQRFAHLFGPNQIGNLPRPPAPAPRDLDEILRALRGQVPRP